MKVLKWQRFRLTTNSIKWTFIVLNDQNLKAAMVLQWEAKSMEMLIFIFIVLTVVWKSMKRSMKNN